MKTEVFITNTTIRAISTRYRIDKKLMSITIQPRALSNKLTFATKNEYEEWKAQNAVFFEKGILICSEADTRKSEKELADKNKELSKKESEKAQKKSESAFSEAEVKAQETHATLKMEIKQEGKKES